MRFRLLGPLEVDADDGSSVRLTGLKRRQLLACLLSADQHTLAVDQLIAMLWPDRDPKSARSSLHVYVYQLRRALLDETRIAHVHGTYTLVVGPNEYDADRFDALLTDGQLAAQGGDSTKAAELMRKALDLWRGEPLAGLDSVDQLREVAARLTSQRLAAIEAAIDAELALGQHTKVIPELTQLVNEHPLSERFRAQLMLALFRSGRQAEALQAYRQGRVILQRELAQEPGRELRNLEQAVVREDPALAWTDGASAPAQQQPPPARVEAKPTMPAELPTDIATFSGRAGEAARLHTYLTNAARGATPIAAIDGTGGVGKSALAIRVAHAVAPEFPHGQLYINLRGATPGVAPLSPQAVLSRFLRALGSNDVPSDLDEATARYRSLTSARRLLVVLDDAYDAAQVRPLLPGGSTCAVLITSRDVMSTVDGVGHLHLDTLTEPDGIELLASLVGSERVDAEPGEALHIVRRCGLLPLAIRIAGARLATRTDWTLATFADRLANAQGRLDELQHADLAVRSSFALSLDQLRADSVRGDIDPARLFELLGLLDTADFAAPVAAALADGSPHHAAAAIDPLVRAQLVQPLGAGKYAMHDLVRLHARELLTRDVDELDRETAIRRALHYYLASARNAMTTLIYDSAPRTEYGTPPHELLHAGSTFRDRVAAADWLAAEQDNLIAVTRQAMTFAPDGPMIAIGMAAALNASMGMHGHWHALAGVHELVLPAAEASGDEATIALAHGDLGRAYRLSGRRDDAERHFERALAGWQRVDDRDHEADILFSLGSIYARRGHRVSAEQFFQRALQIRRNQQDMFGVAHLLNVLGSEANRNGQYPDALEYFDQALTIFRQLDERRGEGMALENTAETHLAAGDPKRAVPLYLQATLVYDDAGDKLGESVSFWNLGRALNALGDPDEAKACWRSSLTILRDLHLIAPDEIETILASPDPQLPAHVNS
ncbi:AfsR/SARP family transcriptional regulator [Tenggerimyces flavus]|uniref:BTAD domain-containing putative transcriptional regulator n=1 Tax=Tenggerimyces flavus TaxID=1708749 RepID=A0ABV7YDZ6_9ACTN|nr:BTAD domain-containing putative transcriptional regulator [Tenggerimyces flavus]MBM7785999.1 DNA-binding SARP family transcriptional activator/Tfp pilus assembly protein PilF [Tenggerimyces flavus]